MGILGKDLFYMPESFFEFTVLFAGAEYEVQGRTYKLGEVLTGFLEYDAADYLAEAKKEAPDIAVLGRLGQSMPLFDQLEDNFYLLESGRTKLQYFMDLAQDIELIQTRYKWFLSEMKTPTGASDNANRYAAGIYNGQLHAFVSGRSLGTDHEVDPAAIAMQYEVREATETEPAKLFERMVFGRLSDFIYVEFFRALMQESIPKKCKLCGHFFLQEKGFLYEYCERVAPNETENTCRDIGSLTSFRLKVQDNDIWKVHQRAYKKYYARVLKKTMSKTEFEEWAKNAEKLRDAALARLEERNAPSKGVLAKALAAELNRE